MNVIDQMVTDTYSIYHADTVPVSRTLPDNSVHVSVFSPPFSSLYTYSNSPRDMGNVRDDAQFFAHFAFVVAEQFRVMKPGRIVAMHCMNLPTSKERDGYIGIRDFRGDLIRAYEKAGFIYHAEVCIWKDPVVAMQRTKAIGLLWKQLRKDSALSRMGIADYVVFMRKPGANDDPVAHTPEEFPVDLWQKWASPIWTDIDQSDTLQHASAREDADERHIAPLQLEVIRRCLRLYSNPGEIVWSPYAGIGSEGYVALQLGRRFIGAELKESYYRQAVRNLASAVRQPGLFDPPGAATPRADSEPDPFDDADPFSE